MSTDYAVWCVPCDLGVDAITASGTTGAFIGDDADDSVMLAQLLVAHAGHEMRCGEAPESVDMVPIDYERQCRFDRSGQCVLPAEHFATGSLCRAMNGGPPEQDEVEAQMARVLP